MNLEPSKFKKSFVEHLEAIVGADGYSMGRLERIAYARDSNFKSVIEAQYNRVPYPPDGVVWPTTAQEVAAIVKLCARSKVPIVPYGGGSGVSGGTTPLRGGLVVDLKKLKRFISLDPINLVAEVETGMMGMHLEEHLAKQGFTMGHFPSSILCASVGGYLAARSAGQLSSKYGKIEDMVQDLEVVTGRGEIVKTRNVSNREGMDLNQVFVGSEGTLGLITKATLRVYPLPQHRTFGSFRFKNMRTAMEAIRRIMQSGLKPAVVRLYDELDTMLAMSSKGSSGKLSDLKFLKDFIKMKSLNAALLAPSIFRRAVNSLPVGCLLVLMHEGSEKLVAAEQKFIAETARSLGGEDLGEKPARHWYEHRYSVSFNVSPLFYQGFFTDTIEVAATWDKLPALYQSMSRAIGSYAVVMAHLSHVYQEGGSFYFTFVAPLRGEARSQELYDLIWDKALKACLKSGGTVSHHHGVGRLKAKYMGDEWGDGVEIFRLLKEFYDPFKILNPGKLIVLDEKKHDRSAA